MTFCGVSSISPHELLNPEIQYKSGCISDYEGCLSLPGLFGKVERSEVLSLQYRNRFGEKEFIEVKDGMARCFLHEIDHLHGILFIDRVTEDFLLNEATRQKVPLRELLDLLNEKLRPLER